MAPADGPLADELAARGVELLPFQCRAADGTRLPQSRLREELARCSPSASGPAARQQPGDGAIVGAGGRRTAIAQHRPPARHRQAERQAVADLNCHRRLLAVSQATRTYHVAGGIAAEKTHVLYNGVDLDEFRPRPPTGYLHRELGLPPDAQLIGTIGQIGLRKGQDVLLRRRAQIAERLPDAPLSDRRRAQLGKGRIAAIRGAICAAWRRARWPGGSIFSAAATTSAGCSAS